MGMGEPLHNYDATMKALRILADEHGLAMSPRRITLSTVGVLPALERLATEPFMPNLAISLHATTEEQRDLLVPINRKYGLQELLDACRRFPLKRRERITFEYVMLKDVNDTPEDARRLVRLLSGIRGKVNLLPLNEAAGIPFERPSDERVNRFAPYPRRPRRRRLRPQEPRPGYPRRVRTAHHRVGSAPGARRAPGGPDGTIPPLVSSDRRSAGRSGLRCRARSAPRSRPPYSPPSRCTDCRSRRRSTPERPLRRRSCS